MDPLAVPKDSAARSGAPGAASAAGTPATGMAAPEVPTPPVIRALQGHGLRVVLFAAAGGATGTDAYDGLIIERVSSAAMSAPARAPKPRAAAEVPAHAPAAGSPAAAPAPR
jgi:hypothetical protein